MKSRKVLYILIFFIIVVLSITLILMILPEKSDENFYEIDKEDRKCADPGEDIYNPNIFEKTPAPCCSGLTPKADNKGALRCPLIPPSGGGSNKLCINFNESTQDNIKCCDGTLLDNNVCTSKCSFLADCDMGTGKDKKVIVIRHGCDLDKWSSGTYTSYLPSGETKTYGLQGLSPFGCEQAHALAVALPKFIKDKNYAPITEVSVQDPSPSGETSNPFRTVFNFIKSCNIKNVTFNNIKSTKYHTGKNVNTNNNTDGSLLLCYTSQVINGINKRINNPEQDSILYKLQRQFNVQGVIKGPPWKAYTIYVFSEGRVEYYHLDTDKKEIVGDGWLSGNKPC